ncbi:MAG TPA: arginine deiminase family protein [Bryobacteraceae bacterium]|nr:arginine deiminase family protein [Bryobacteraceae bacterium]
MLTALTRAVSRSLASCELTWLNREPINIELAIIQHTLYEEALAAMGLRVISLPEQPDLPDAVFVEDPLFVVDELAILTRMGAESRRAESESLAAAIAPHRPIRQIAPPATLEGGDIMRIGRDIFVGLSTRTNAEGILQLRHELEPLGYRILPVEVHGCLHLKSACCSIGDGLVLANRAWLDAEALEGYTIVDVDPREPSAANVLRIGNAVLMPAAFPHTRSDVAREGLDVRTVDISELMKAEAAITCSSVIFETA